MRRVKQAANYICYLIGFDVLKIESLCPPPTQTVYVWRRTWDRAFAKYGVKH